MTSEKIKVLIVDDTALYRKILRDVLSEFPEIEVVGSAANGKIALDKLDALNPDIMTLDIEMPLMGGLETLRNLKQQHRQMSVIMVSAHTTKDAKITLEALELGAFDFITKPDGSTIDDNTQHLREQFKPKIEAFFRRKEIKDRLSKKHPDTTKVSTPSVSEAFKPSRQTFSGLKPTIIALGISTGGPKALGELIPALPGNLPVPIVVVQHMPPVFTKALADSLDKKSALKVVEAHHGQTTEAGTVYIAPGGKQMKIIASSKVGASTIQITDDPPENHCKPSADYLFRSVAGIYKGRTLGVIMTGMGHDGTLGLRLLKRHGARVLAQDEKSCVVFGMPMEAIKAGVVDDVLPLSNLAAKITQIAKGNG